MPGAETPAGAPVGAPGYLVPVIVGADPAGGEPLADGSRSGLWAGATCPDGPATTPTPIGPPG
jgi:hypothetical protein